MVSKARLLLPEPDRPVRTTSLSRGMRKLTFWRLCSLAPSTTMNLPSASCGKAGGVDVVISTDSIIRDLTVSDAPCRLWRGGQTPDYTASGTAKKRRTAEYRTIEPKKSEV